MCLRRDDEMSFQRGQGGREKASAPVPSLNSDLHCLPDESWLALPRLRCRKGTARGEVGSANEGRGAMGGEDARPVRQRGSAL